MTESGSSPDVVIVGAGLIGVDLDGPGWLRIHDGLIAEVGGGPAPSDCRVVAVPGGHLGPGLIDLHLHGGFGVDLMAADADEIDRLSRGLTSRGVTSFVATTYAAGREETLAAVRRLAAATGATSGADLLGVHLEGPWLAPTRAGAHPPEFLRAPDPDELAALLETGGVRIVVHAPELHGAAELRRSVRSAGAVVAIGHTDASEAIVRVAIDEGASLITHLFNAMPGLGHRAPGPVGVALTDRRVVCEVIADGAHVHPLVLDLVWRTAGADRIAAVSDSGPGVDERGRREGALVVLPDGSVLEALPALDDALRTLVTATGAPLSELWRTVASTPARVLGLSDRGRVDVGCRADLVWLDSEQRVGATWVRGALCFADPARSGLETPRFPERGNTR